MRFVVILFSYIDLEKRIRADHPLRVIRTIANTELKSLSSRSSTRRWAASGPAGAADARVAAAGVLFDPVGEANLFRWFVGCGIEDPVWDATTFTKNRDRLLEGDIAAQFLPAVLAQDQVKELLSSAHFSVDGALLEALASLKSFRPKDGSGQPPDPGRMASGTFTASGGATTRMPQAPIPTPASFAKDRARRRGCASWTMR